MTSNQDGIAVASSCMACAGEIGNPPECRPGAHMGIVHASCVTELQALGWIRTADPDGGPDDIACPHYHAKYWRG